MVTRSLERRAATLGHGLMAALLTASCAQIVGIDDAAVLAPSTAGMPVARDVPGVPTAQRRETGQADTAVENLLGWQPSVHPTLRNAAKLAQYAYVKSSNLNGPQYFGQSVAISGDTLVVGAWGERSAATGVNGKQDDRSLFNSGAVYVFRRSGKTWQQEAHLKASDAGFNDHFGSLVALSGDTLAVAASNKDKAAPNGPTINGAVYVFHRTGTTWRQEAFLEAPGTGSKRFANSLALSGDILAVGAYGENSAATGVDGNQEDDSARTSGAVYVFRRTGTAWRQEAYLKASNTGARDLFGSEVTLSGDTLAVGAMNEDSAATGVDGDQADNSVLDSGAVYVFRRIGTTWRQEAYLKASNTGASDNFGSEVALSGDTLAVAARREGSAATGINGDQRDDSADLSGAVYVFQRTRSAWQQAAYVKASNAQSRDWFGNGVALSDDTLAVGASRESSAATGVNGNQADNRVWGRGAVYLFR